MSTPAASNLIRKSKADGGILCTASHNPGGLNNDFGIKFNVCNGGPAPESITNQIYERSKNLKSYSIAKVPELNLDSLGSHKFDSLTVEIVDSVNDYVTLMKELFDFSAIQKFFAANREFKLLFDSMHGVTGPYVKRIFVDELGLPVGSVMNVVPLPDFGGGHPDPNMTYAHDLVKRVQTEKIDLAFASDGDGDRNMVLSHDWFLTPSDSVAVIAAHHKSIPSFASGLRGVARSMPTSKALDRVAAKAKVSCYETPTGWKFFGNLMDANLLSLCGEESFGTGADHIREKDGVWATLAWVSIIASASQRQNKIATLRSIMEEHYKAYGRNYFQRYDFENVSCEAGNRVMSEFQSYLPSLKTEKSLKVGQPLPETEFKLVSFEDFSYKDPVNGSVSNNQGLYMVLEPEARVIVRLSGTGSSGATIRVYLESYCPVSKGDLMQPASQVLEPLKRLALRLTRLTEFTGREEPTVIT